MVSSIIRLKKRNLIYVQNHFISVILHIILRTLSLFEAVNKVIYLRKPISCRCVYLNGAIQPPKTVLAGFNTNHSLPFPNSTAAHLSAFWKEWSEVKVWTEIHASWGQKAWDINCRNSKIKLDVHAPFEVDHFSRLDRSDRNGLFHLTIFRPIPITEPCCSVFSM